MRRRKYLLEFLVATFAGLVVYCANIFVVAGNTTYRYAIELWNYGREYLHVLYPFIFTAPFCWILFYEKNGSYWKNVYNRTTLRKYIAGRIVLGVSLAALAMLIVSSGSLVFAYIIAPMGRKLDFHPDMLFEFYGEYQLAHPVIYALLLSCWRAVLAAAYAAFSIGVTMLSRNIFVSMTGAFVYSILENFVFAILQAPAWSICTSFYPNRLNSAVITVPGLLAGPFVLLLATVFVFICYRKKGMESLMD